MSWLWNWRTLLLGVASWGIPFVASFVLFDRSGALALPQPLFKSLMIVIFGSVGALLLVAAFRRVAPTLANGAALGLCLLTINLGLDFAILMPMTHMSGGAYLQDIGLRYLLIPNMAMAIGAVAERAR